MSDMRMEDALAEIEQLKAELARIRGLPRLAALDDDIERLRALVMEAINLAELYGADAMNIRRALEPKP